MGAVATFILSDWRAQFPMFSNVGDAQVMAAETAAAQICRNDGGSPIPTQYVDTQTQALYWLTAHICQLLYGSVSQPATPGLLGRVSDAAEGTVHVGTEYMPMTPTNAWFNQTQFGAFYWQLILPWRLGFYVPKITPLVQPFANMGLGFGGRRGPGWPP